jgi:hypothetical protein
MPLLSAGRMPAVTISWSGCAPRTNSERRKTAGMPLLSAGMDAGCFYSLGFSHGENPRPTNGRMPLLSAGRMPAVTIPWSWCAPRTNSERRKTAGMPFCARARDRKGAEQPRREAPGPEAKPQPWIARSPPQAGMRPTHMRHIPYREAPHTRPFPAAPAPGRKRFRRNAAKPFKIFPVLLYWMERWRLMVL